MDREKRLIQGLRDISAKDATKLESWLEKRRQVSEEGEDSEGKSPENVLIGPSTDKVCVTPARVLGCEYPETTSP